MNPQVLMLLPFGDQDEEFFFRQLSHFLNSRGITTMRFDARETLVSWKDPLLEGIQKADAIICDLTGQNPNVLYELGMAHALKKPTILVINKKETEPIPADLHGALFWVYDPTHLQKMDNLAHNIYQVIADNIQLKPTDSELTGGSDG